MMDHLQQSPRFGFRPTEAGRPTFVMELVLACRSPSSTLLCDAITDRPAPDGRRERLELFLTGFWPGYQPCAHQCQHSLDNQAVERHDITLYDASRRPKVIDFFGRRQATSKS